jgi:hypothetical protein
LVVKTADWKVSKLVDRKDWRKAELTAWMMAVRMVSKWVGLMVVLRVEEWAALWADRRDHYSVERMVDWMAAWLDSLKVVRKAD